MGFDGDLTGSNGDLGEARGTNNPVGSDPSNGVNGANGPVGSSPSDSGETNSGLPGVEVSCWNLLWFL